MAYALMVPVQLDFLHCPKDRVVVRSTADYSLLPWTDADGDHNADTAQLSEEIVGRPFQDESSVLRAGVHLHWALPDALTRGRHRNGQSGSQAVFPAVPNRWLVRRRAAGPLAERAWVVESDFVHPEGTGESSGVAVPYPARTGHRPYRYLGRAVPRELWPARNPGDEYVKTLTAVGFGLGDDAGYSDPTFAALYPNCHSVFGFHDPEVGESLPAGLRYDVVGWYEQGNQDFLRTVEAEARTAKATIADTLLQYADWQVPANAPDPVRSICYASCGFRPDAAPPKSRPTTITVGNTATEALSVALANGISAADRFVLEEQLEAILLAPRTAHRQVDVDAKFIEARHEKGFTARRGGQLWTVVPARTAATPRPADAGHSQAQVEVPLPPALAGLLDALNAAQEVRDRAAAAVDALRGQLFADWYKYQLCAYPPDLDGELYPDIDEARAFVQAKSLDAVNELAGALLPGPDTPEGRLQTALTAVRNALTALNADPTLVAAGTRYELTTIDAARYWQPTDPVLHLMCDDAVATERHGRDGTLDCRVVPLALFDDVVVGRAGSVQALVGDSGPGFRDGDGSPWHPFQLEWEVELAPLRAKGNVHPEVDSYDTDYVTANYTLDTDGPDLRATGASPALADAAAVYSGTALLSGHAGDRLRDQLSEHLEAVIVPEYLAATNTVAPWRIQQLQAWYEQRKPSNTDPVYTAIRAYAAVSTMDCLAQSLSGFNDALLMHRLVKQLPIGDPLGFSEDQAFATAVRTAVGPNNRSAPEPLNDFVPIRTGALRLLRLRLVDTFGQTRDVDCDRVVPAESLTVRGNPDLIALPPRISQPARVVFRWRAAEPVDGEDRETNDHPDTTPVCGWLLPDHVDTSIMVYATDGRALGSIDGSATWRPAPGGTGVAKPADIRNRHLSAFVADILAQGPAFIDALMDILDTALDNIEPESTAEHVDLAVLIGRPIALVRAEIDLEVLGRPAVHQGWNQFRHDLNSAVRDNDGFTRVKFPIRLGALKQLDDGLIGYWVEGEPTFRSPVTDHYNHPAIRTAADGPLDVPQSLDDPPQVVRMLVDPRGKVHVTSGVQPVKSISIPPAHYAASMATIEMTFPCEPLLTDRDAVNLPLPVEPGYRWAWVNQTAGAWSEVTLAASISRDVFVAAVAERVWDQLVDPHIGWLRAEATGGYRAVPPAERQAAALDAPLRSMTARIEAVLATAAVHERAAALVRLADDVAVPAWAGLLAAGWLQALPETTTRAGIAARDGRAALAGDLAGADPVLDAVLDLGEERIGTASTTATVAAPQYLRGGWLKLRHETAG